MGSPTGQDGRRSPIREVSMKAADVKKVAVVGTGLMGHGIAQVFALAGYPVAIYDKDPARVQAAKDGIGRNLELFRERGLVTAEGARAALARIRPCTELSDAVGDVDFVMEAVFEDIGVKRQVHSEIDKVAPERTVIASNTSGLDVNQMGPATNRPDKVIVAHFSNPPHIIPVVEVVKGEQTSDETVDLTVDLLRKVGKYPVLLRHHIAGFIWNRLQYAMFREAVGIVEKGIASPEDIDNVIKLGLGRRYTTVGPLETADVNGLALFHQIAQYLYPELDASQGPHPIHTKLIEEGANGVVAGRGFHDWSGGKAEATRRRRDDELIRWLKADQAEAKPAE
jgi:3-hydroxyacyl-CoA dehydrogenase